MESKILIVDDHYIVRRGVRQILADEFPDAQIAEASNPQEAIELVWKQEWNVVILDINMPGRGGLDVLKDIKRERPKAQVIVLTMHPIDQFAVRVLRNGAASYLTKESVGRELLDAVRAALSGRKYILPAVADMLANHVEQETTRPLHELLSDREYRVLCMIASGKTVKEIGAELCLSVKSISTYRNRVLKKLHLNNNAELMRYALKHRLVDIDEDAAPPPDEA